MSFRSINWQNVTRFCGLGAISLATVGCLSNGTVVEGGDDGFNVGTVQQRIETYRSATVFIGGNQYDMVGQGTVTGTRCLTPCGPLEMRARLAYTFSVGEPLSLISLLASTVAIGFAFLVHRRSGVVHI